MKFGSKYLIVALVVLAGFLLLLVVLRDRPQKETGGDRFAAPHDQRQPELPVMPVVEKQGPASSVPAMEKIEPAPVLEEAIPANTTNIRLPGEPVNPPPTPASVPEPATPEIGWARANLTIGGQSISPANHFGQIQPIRIPPAAKIEVEMQWPKAQSRMPVSVEVVNSGFLEGGALSRLYRVDESGTLKFEYTANDQPGTCLVVLRSGFYETTLTFEVPGGNLQSAAPMLVVNPGETP